MKIRVPSNIFLERLERCARVARDNSPLAVSAFVRLALDSSGKDPLLQLTVVTDNVCADTVLICEVDEPGDPVLINCTQLHTAVRHLEQSPSGFRLEINDRTAVLKDAHQPKPRSYRIPVRDASQYPELPKASGEMTVDLPSDMLRLAIESTLYSTSHDRPHLGLIFLEVEPTSLRVIATNGYTLARRQFDKQVGRKVLVALPTAVGALSDAKRDSFIRSVLLLTEAKDPITLTMTQSRVFVESRNTMVCAPLPAAFNTDFGVVLNQPPYEKFCLLRSDDLKRSLGDVCVLARSEEEWKKIPCVKIALKDEVVTVSAVSALHQAEDNFSVTAPDYEFVLFVNPSFLQDALTAAKSELVKLHVDPKDDLQPVRLSSEDETYTSLITRMTNQ